MLDLHCHILPNVDDGASSLQEALAMARFALNDGITHIVATPHCHRYIHTLRRDILPRVAQLNRELIANNIPVTILPGSEIQASDTDLYRREYEEGVVCHLGDSRAFTLLEFSWKNQLYPTDAPELIAWLIDQGTIPIIAHPERYNYFTSEPQRLNALIEAGGWLQITVDSLLGHHGPDAKRAADTILDSKAIMVLASDAHNMRRCSGLSVGYQWLKTHKGEAKAEELRRNAETVLAAIGD